MGRIWEGLGEVQEYDKKYEKSFVLFLKKKKSESPWKSDFLKLQPSLGTLHMLLCIFNEYID